MPRLNEVGQLELMVLLAVMRLGDEAYGVPIARAIETSRGREVALGRIYFALGQLEKRQLIASSMGPPTSERGGRAKRYFTITAEGLQSVRAARRTLTTLWRGLPQLKGHET
jgi:PadR family transcriptional regulator PadR